VACLDRQRREVAGHAGEQRYLGIGDGAAAGRPLAAEGKVVKRERLQIVAEYSPQGGRPSERGEA